ncbi:multidrug and toxin extrusion protein 2-like [Rana temporaria]|uniref:multidrug and toxin extrusion protein 2-like n=1 Tax=Rana temporaria TaxID=8407 RepID=UPI001AAE0CE6|nr:multidrug and toxin extrusion protein 2-like [Rana temporaria]
MKRHKEEAKETSPLSEKPNGINRLFRQLVPYGFCNEAKKQLGLAIPVFLSQAMVYLIFVVSSVFCGHLGKIELDSVTLASAVINITGITIGYGMSDGCDTMMSQTYGSKNMKRVGTILQRGILILMLCCFPCWAILINTEQVLLLCKQNPDIARLTQKYVMIFLPALPAVFLQQLQIRYLQNQGIMWPQFFICLAVNIVNAVVNAIFIHVFKMGVVGSACANTVSQWAMALLLFLYIVGKKVHVKTWGGWSKDCLQEWDIFLSLALPSMLMFCVEYWSFEIGGFLAGLISIVELGGQTIMIELVTMTSMFPMGFGMAANIRVGNALGDGDIEQAKKSCKVALYCTACVCLLISSAILALRNVMGYVFTNDMDIVTLVSRIMLLFAPFHLCDGTNVCCNGILRGTGKQKIGAITNIFGYYLIGIPVGISLMFPAKLGVIGLWIGIFCPVLLQNFIYISYILSINWQQACEEAKIRAGVKPLKVMDPSISQTDDSSSKIDLVESGDTTASYFSFDAIPMYDMNSGENHTKQLEIKNDLPMETTTVVGEILSTKQLIIRRGLALLLSISVLIIGIIIKLFTAKR